VPTTTPPLPSRRAVVAGGGGGSRGGKEWSRRSRRSRASIAATAAAAAASCRSPSASERDRPPPAAVRTHRLRGRYRRLRAATARVDHATAAAAAAATAAAAGADTMGCCGGRRRRRRRRNRQRRDGWGRVLQRWRPRGRGILCAGRWGKTKRWPRPGKTKQWRRRGKTKRWRRRRCKAAPRQQAAPPTAGAPVKSGSLTVNYESETTAHFNQFRSGCAARRLLQSSSQSASDCYEKAPRSSSQNSSKTVLRG